MELNYVIYKFLKIYVFIYIGMETSRTKVVLKPYAAYSIRLAR